MFKFEQSQMEHKYPISEGTPIYNPPTYESKVKKKNNV